jgi:hypothetical protein
LDQIAIEDDPEKLKRHWIDAVLRFFEIMPDAVETLLRELANRGITHNPPTESDLPAASPS